MELSEQERTNTQESMCDTGKSMRNLCLDMGAVLHPPSRNRNAGEVKKVEKTTRTHEGEIRCFREFQSGGDCKE